MILNVKGDVVQPQSYSSKCDFMTSITSFFSELFNKLLFYYKKFYCLLNLENNVWVLLLTKVILKGSVRNLTFPGHKKSIKY